MASVLITHGHAHRLLFNNIIESAPVTKMGKQVLEIDHTQWRQRQPESMDLTGGDYELIKSTLKQLAFTFPTGLQRTSKPEYVQPEVVDSVTIL